MKCVGKKLSVELREECIVLVWALIVALSHLLCKKHYPSYLAPNHHFLLTHRKKSLVIVNCTKGITVEVHDPNRSLLSKPQKFGDCKAALLVLASYKIFLLYCNTTYV